MEFEGQDDVFNLELSPIKKVEEGVEEIEIEDKNAMFNNGLKEDTKTIKKVF